MTVQREGDKDNSRISIKPKIVWAREVEIKQVVDASPGSLLIAVGRLYGLTAEEIAFI